ncbi:MAG: HAD hydrolase-like protein [Lachnospiraceae bacterium]|nr:HAD hydrolase-like protein [bacterium]MDY5517556.1 HAD hydrolase-like protein [Lachnospiraceae bacterium]
MKKVLFDLDGTLINSQEGITKGVQYALRESLGIDEPDLESLRCFIGPPLALMFDQKYHVPAEKIEPAVAKYREYYDAIGMNQCELYPGVIEALEHLRQKGYVLGLASSKPEISCEQILKNKGIAGYFDYIVGASMGPERREKVLVLEEAFRRMGVSERSEVVLIGDTKYDAVGAVKAGIDCIGVTYGFGTREELFAAGAVQVFDTLEEVEAYLDELEANAES